MCYKRGFSQLVCACTYVASMRDSSMIVCYHQVLFVAVTKLLRFLEEKNYFFLLIQVFTKFHVQSTAHVRLQLYVTGKLPVYTVCPQFKHYVGLVNLPHSSSCPMFPYISLDLSCIKLSRWNLSVYKIFCV